VFAVIFVMNLAFIVLGSLNALPLAAHIIAVSLGGMAIAVMVAFNIIGDVMIARRMFTAPEAYLHALTPAPRRKILLASVITMAVLDIVTMAVVITGEVWLAMNLAGESMWRIVREAFRYMDVGTGTLYVILVTLACLTGYLLILLVILFSATARKSIFYKKSASGALAFLLACGCFYAISLTPFLLMPFPLCGVFRWGAFFMVGFNGVGMFLYILLLCAEAAALFILTSKLMERKMNI
jgi:hypothetical protein